MADPTSEAGNRSDYREAVRILEKNLFGQSIVGPLESLQTSLANGHWREAVFALRRWKKDFESAVPGLASRLGQLFYNMAVRKANRHWLEELVQTIEPPWYDPLWNRARATISENGDEDTDESIQSAIDLWLAYLEDIPKISALTSAEQALAQSMILVRLSQSYVDFIEEVEDENNEGQDNFRENLGDDGDHDDRRERIALWRSRAVECGEKAIKFSPEYAQPYQNLAEMYLDWEQHDPAAETYRRLLEHSPDDLTAIEFLCTYHRRRDEGLLARTMPCTRTPSSQPARKCLASWCSAGCGPQPGRRRSP